MLSFFRNICRFNQCGLEFASLYDLIHHIEQDHLVDEEDSAKRFNHMQQHGQQTASLVPLSYICKYYRKFPDKKPKPITLEPVKMAITAAAGAAPTQTQSMFTGAKKPRQTTNLQNLCGVQQQQHFSQPFTHGTSNLNGPAIIFGNEICDEETVSISNESLSSDSASVLEEPGSNTVVSMNSNVYGTSFHRFTVPASVPDLRFSQTIGMARKRYKNFAGPPASRFHTKIGHPGPAGINYAKSYKCTSCDKTYKTVSGLHNHQMQCSHHGGGPPQSLSGGGGSSSSASSTNAAVSGILAQVAKQQQQQISAGLVGSSSSAAFPRFHQHSTQPMQQQQQRPNFSHNQQQQQQQQQRIFKNTTIGQQQQQRSHVTNMGGAPLALITARNTTMKSGTAIRVSPAQSPSMMKYGGGQSGATHGTSSSMSPLSIIPGVGIQVQQQASPHNRGIVSKPAVGLGPSGVSIGRATMASGIMATSGVKRNTSTAQIGRQVKFPDVQDSSPSRFSTTPTSLSGGVTTKIQISSAYGQSGHATPTVHYVSSSSSTAASDTSGNMGPPILTSHEYAKKE